MTHPVLSRILMLDQVADERFRQHQRRSTSAAAIVGMLTLFGLLEYRVLVEHRVPGTDLGNLCHGRHKNRPHALVSLQKLISPAGVIPCACLAVNSIPKPAAFIPPATSASRSASVPAFLDKHGFGHGHSAVVDGLRFLLLGLAIGLLYWSARRARRLRARS